MNNLDSIFLTELYSILYNFHNCKKLENIIECNIIIFIKLNIKVILTNNESK